MIFFSGYKNNTISLYKYSKKKKISKKIKLLKFYRPEKITAQVGGHSDPGRLWKANGTWQTAVPAISLSTGHCALLRGTDVGPFLFSWLHNKCPSAHIQESSVHGCSKNAWDPWNHFHMSSQHLWSIEKHCCDSQLIGQHICHSSRVPRHTNDLKMW